MFSILNTTAYTLFILTAFALTVTPGPNVIYIITRSVNQGRTSGLFSALGIASGTILYSVATALGISAILASSATLYNVIKILGAIYFVYLGIQKFIENKESVSTNPIKRQRNPTIFIQAFWVNVLNPKTAIFFLSLLPQFIAPKRGFVFAQMMILGLTLALVGFVSDIAYTLAAASVRPWLLTKKSFGKIQNYLTGTIYIALGAIAAVTGSNSKT